MVPRGSASGGASSVLDPGRRPAGSVKQLSSPLFSDRDLPGLADESVVLVFGLDSASPIGCETIGLFCFGRDRDGTAVTTEEYERRLEELPSPPYVVTLKRGRGTLTCDEILSRTGSAVTIRLRDGSTEVFFLMMVESIAPEA